MKLHKKRKLINNIALALSLAAMSFGLFWLAWILITILQLGIAGLSVAVFTQMTPPPGSAGGLANAIFGSFVMVGLATLIGTPVGILAGVYLAEYGRHDRLSSVVRFINDILLSAPSIVIGLFVYEIMVATLGHFSGWAGAVALAVIVVDPTSSPLTVPVLSTARPPDVMVMTPAVVIPCGTLKSMCVESTTSN